MFEQVRHKIILLRDCQVILDTDIAGLYGVETKRINEAVKNNLDKFPEGYMFRLTNEEVNNLRSKFSTPNISSKSRVLPAAFSEKGLYMLVENIKSLDPLLYSKLTHQKNIRIK
nr:ORF6N domain-containing protein [Butyricimonas sp. BSD2780061689_150309_C8]